jgi:hypothetical protein
VKRWGHGGGGYGGGYGGGHGGGYGGGHGGGYGGGYGGHGYGGGKSFIHIHSFTFYFINTILFAFQVTEWSDGADMVAVMVAADMVADMVVTVMAADMVVMVMAAVSHSFTFILINASSIAYFLHFRSLGRISPHLVLSANKSFAFLTTMLPTCIMLIFFDYSSIHLPRNDCGVYCVHHVHNINDVLVNCYFRITCVLYYVYWRYMFQDIQSIQRFRE